MNLNEEQLIPIGSTFGRLTVISQLPRDGSRRRHYLCACECGREVRVAKNHLRSGHTQSCGCLLHERSRQSVTTHGLTKHPLYRTWADMIQRCTNPNQGKYKHYGGRGITVCDRWRYDFAAFYRDMGEKPSPKHTLDRINVNGPYSPENCRWATWKQQARNKRPRATAP